MRDFIFVDTETTGLNSETDELVELSYAVNDGPVTGPLFFGVVEVPDFIDNLTHFTERGISGLRSDEREFDVFCGVSIGATMVAANPTFDAGFLKKKDLFHFHHRMIDLSAYAMGVLGLDEMPGQADVVRILEETYHFELPQPNHTSAADVAALQASFYALRAIAKTKRV